MKKCFVGYVLAGLLFALVPSLAAAQATASLNGRVTDESGGVLPGVTVTVTQTDTGLTRSVVTEAQGEWLVPNLPTGPYRLEVGLQGFKTYVQTGIVLQVAANPTINVVLGVGNLEETVSVEAAAPIVDVRSAGISEVVEQERIVELPLQGRQVTDLITLAGAAIQTTRPNSRSFQGGVNISVAGGLDFGVAYMLDGAFHNDVQNAGGMPLPFPDALQEFRVATSGTAASNGMHSGASVNAVTKSGTNQYHGNAFEFLRHHKFNAASPFAPVGADGKRVDDGLKRNQFGGTIGGPVVRDRLFFFGAYQGTPTRVTPSDNIAYVPTAAMLAGDFSGIASPACNNGRQLTLRAPFVNNQVSPALLSPAALALTKQLPTTTDPCGRTTFSLPSDRDEAQYVARVDYQLRSNNSIFGRYMATTDKQPVPLASSGNVLTTILPGVDNVAQSATLGNTIVLGTNTVNAARFAFNRTTVNRFNEDFFAPADLGIDAYEYSPTKELILTVSAPGFAISAATATRGIATNNSYQWSDDITLVRGSHQLAFGVNTAHWTSVQKTWARGGGTWEFNGTATGLGLADFLLGRVSLLEQGDAGGVELSQWYTGVYAQDTWRAANRVTVNAGLRWEPFTGQQIKYGAIANFDHDNFINNVKSTVYKNAPAGFLYPGDEGFPDGQSGFKPNYWNIAPRLGVAWDVTGDGRMSVRSSYGLNYDMPVGETWFRLAAGPPYGNRTRLSDVNFDRPYSTYPGGNPHPIAISANTVYPSFGAFGAIDPNINAPRTQSWNVTLERQIGSEWGVSASYLGSHADRLWGIVTLNPGTYQGQGPCVLNGVSYPVCTVNGNLNQRRKLYLENPSQGQYIANLDALFDTGSNSYRGLKLAFQRRSAAGLSLNGNYTLSRCFGLDWANTGGTAGGYENPDDPDADRGHCDADRTHIANFTAGILTPHVGSGVVDALVSNWRFSGIVNARSGSWLTVATGVSSFNGVGGTTGLRVDQVSDDVYGEKTLNSYLNRAAFALPAPGTFGDHERNSIRGPGFWKIDLAISRLFSFSTSQNVEVRLEAFNLLNNFNWGNPIVNFSSGLFGRIQTVAGDMRIMQFGVKYSF
jgi:hypothetical protein